MTGPQIPTQITRSATGTDESVGESPMLRVDGLQKVYGTGEQAITAVDDVSFEVGQGTVLGLLGPNGAGKTTLIKMILGLILPTTGTVTFRPEANGETRHRYECASAVLEGARNVYWKLTARENLAFFASLQGIDARDAADYHQELLERFGIADRADEPVQNFSRGMKQRAALAGVLARETPVVFLDEPTLGLDVEASQRLRTELSKIAVENRTVIVSSHDMDVIQEICDRVIILNEGRIVADDSVDNLIDVFSTRTFRVEVSPSLPPASREQMAEYATVDSWTESNGTTEFEVTLSNDEALYDLMELLRTFEVAVEGIESAEPSLEEIFLQYVSDDAVAGEGGAPGGESA